MAKPIEATPILEKEDKAEFLMATREAEEKPDPKLAKFLNECFELYSKQKF